MQQLSPLDKVSDEDLMRLAQQADRDAFSILYERYSFSILMYLRRMLGSREDTESIGQEVFVRALRFAPTYRHPNRFSTWLFTIARNEAINHARRRTRTPVRSITELNLDGIDFGDRHQTTTRTLDEMEKREEIARAIKAMEGLSTDQRDVIALGVFQNLSYPQMEEILGDKAVTLRSRMFHGLKRLSYVMSEDYVAAASVRND
jgi:RNA polymerase sigma-70 factor (ECF subfamily)